MITTFCYDYLKKIPKPKPLALGLLISLLSALPPTLALANEEAPSLLDLYHTALPIRSPHLKPQVLQLALKAYMCAKQADIIHKELLTIVDYSLPSDIKRLWVIDVPSKRVLFNTLVAHGQGSGGQTYARVFSDKAQTHASSIGVFVTANKYYGHYGAALRLKGLEVGFNSHAFSRDIVMHSAWYVNENLAQHYGHIGRSWGCFALNTQINEQLIDLIKEGTLLVSYYPEPKWLAESHFLHCRDQ